MTKINKEIENYYKSFLTSRISQEKNNDYEDHFALFTLDLQNPKLCQDEVRELEHDLTKDELLNALKGSQPTRQNSRWRRFYERIYETFFELLWRSVIASFNETFQTGKPIYISEARNCMIAYTKGRK